MSEGGTEGGREREGGRESEREIYECNCQKERNRKYLHNVSVPWALFDSHVDSSISQPCPPRHKMLSDRRPHLNTYLPLEQ